MIINEHEKMTTRGVQILCRLDDKLRLDDKNYTLPGQHQEIIYLRGKKGLYLYK